MLGKHGAPLNDREHLPTYLPNYGVFPKSAHLSDSYQKAEPMLGNHGAPLHDREHLPTFLPTYGVFPKTAPLSDSYQKAEPMLGGHMPIFHSRLDYLFKYASAHPATSLATSQAFFPSTPTHQNSQARLRQAVDQSNTNLKYD